MKSGIAKKLLLVAVIAAAAALLIMSRPSFSASEPINLQPAPTDQASVTRGQTVYEQKCQWCHGIKGDGTGPAANFVYPKPRDFTKGEYKFRTTQSGEIPTDWDIYRSITKGLPGTAMYAWGNALPDSDRWDLVAYLKTFSTRFKNEQYTKDKVLTIPYADDPGKASAAILQQGDKLFHDPNGAKCFMCHGAHGRGNGPSADTLTDDWNNKIWPADLTKGFDLRGGSTAQDIYRDISTGLEGSPMPSFNGALNADPKTDEQDRWDLAYYIQSLQVPRKLGSLVKVVRVSAVPTDPNDPKWNSIDWIDIPLAGQVIQNPREFTPSTDNLSVKACYDDKNVSFLIYWDDRTQNSATQGKKFPDGVGLQFPVSAPADPTQSAKPYFAMGDPDHPVDLWYWNAEQAKASELNAWGSAKIVPKTGSPSVTAKPVYDDGMWKVVFTRPLNTATTQTDLQFKVGQFIPLSFAVWDGNNGETGGKGSISSWYYCLLIPPTSSGVYVAPIIALALGILIELWVAGKARENADNILS